MKISLHSCRVSLSILCLALLLPILASAAPFAYPGSVPSGGDATWYVSDNINGVVPVQGNPGPGGFGFSDAEFNDPASGGDAYDGGFVMRINNTLFAGPVNGATLNGNTLSSGSTTYSGVSVQAQFWFDPNAPIIRSLYSFSNPSATATNISLRWEVNLGSDTTTTLAGSTTGGATATAADHWLVTSDGGNGDLVNTLVRYGMYAPHAPDSSTFLPGTAGGGSDGDLLADVYNVTLQPGQTISLMMFGELSSISGGLSSAINSATNDAATMFTDYNALDSAGLLADLGVSRSQIINWGEPVPEPTMAAMFAVGAGFFFTRRRKSHR